MPFDQCQELAWLNDYHATAVSKGLDAVKNPRVGRDEIRTILLCLKHVSGILSDVLDFTVSRQNAFDFAQNRYLIRRQLDLDRKTQVLRLGFHPRRSVRMFDFLLRGVRNLKGPFPFLYWSKSSTDALSSGAYFGSKAQESRKLFVMPGSMAMPVSPSSCGQRPSTVQFSDLPSMICFPKSKQWATASSRVLKQLPAENCLERVSSPRWWTM